MHRLAGVGPLHAGNSRRRSCTPITSSAAARVDLALPEVRLDAVALGYQRDDVGRGGRVQPAAFPVAVHRLERKPLRLEAAHVGLDFDEHARALELCKLIDVQPLPVPECR